jgi:hypothetical protein
VTDLLLLPIGEGFVRTARPTRIGAIVLKRILAELVVVVAIGVVRIAFSRRI